MPNEKSFTMSELKAHWQKYRSITGLRIMKQGKAIYKFGKMDGSKNIDGTRAEVVRLSQVMSFIKYLEEYA